MLHLYRIMSHIYPTFKSQFRWQTLTNWSNRDKVLLMGVLCLIHHTKLICPCLRGCLIRASCYSCQLNTQKQHRPRQFHSSCCQYSIMQVCDYFCATWTHCCINSTEMWRGSPFYIDQRAQSVSQHPDRGKPWLGPVNHCGQGCLSWTQQQWLDPKMH